MGDAPTAAAMGRTDEDDINPGRSTSEMFPLLHSISTAGKRIKPDGRRAIFEKHSVGSNGKLTYTGEMYPVAPLTKYPFTNLVLEGGAAKGSRATSPTRRRLSAH